jgi:glycosyltransferase involved in cell wall biosynthesis
MKDGKIIVARLWPTFGGNIPTVIPVICGMDPEQYETIGIYLTKTSDVPNLLEQNGKKIFFVTRKEKLPIFPLSFFRLAKILKEQKVDILHCHHHRATYQGIIAGLLAKVPIMISHVHGMGRTRNLSRKIQNYFLFPHVDKIFAVGQATQKDIVRFNPSVNPEKVVNIGNSIDFKYFSTGNYNRQAFRAKYNIPQDAFLFSTAGRLAPTKGQMYLVEAFAKIKNKIPNAKLFFAGSGQLKEDLEKKAAELGCQDSIYLPGKIGNMPEFYNSIDCFLLPSVAEGLPRTLLEAMAGSVLCIASDVGGIPEILDNGKYGLLTPPENTDAIANAMMEAFNMPAQKRESIIAQAKEHVKINYSYEIMIKRIENIYSELTTKKRI